MRTPLLFVLLTLVAGAASAAELAPGNLAPKLEVKRWVKGEPLSALPEKGVAVVEFWATWCGPCVQTIPHLTDLAKKHSQATFVGVSIWEDDSDSLDKFVAGMGQKMNYRVAYSGNQSGMAKSWMEPALQQGIPTAFLIKDGVVQWIGHPSDLDGPLEQVVSGTFDLEAAKRAFAANSEGMEAEAKVRAQLSAAGEAFDKGNREEAHRLLNALEQQYPDMPLTEDLKLIWRVQESPKAFYKSIQTKLKRGGTTAAREVAETALRLGGNRKTEPDALKLMTLSAEATKGKIADILFVAISLHQELRNQMGAAKLANLGLKAIKSRRDRASGVRKRALLDVVRGKAVDGNMLVDGRTG